MVRRDCTVCRNWSCGAGVVWLVAQEQTLRSVQGHPQEPLRTLRRPRACRPTAAVSQVSRKIYIRLVMIFFQFFFIYRHTARCTNPYPWSRSVNWCLAKETEISAALWALWLRKDFTLRYTFTKSLGTESARTICLFGFGRVKNYSVFFPVANSSMCY